MRRRGVTRHSCGEAQSFLYDGAHAVRPLRLTVRTPGFQPGNRGSIPLGGTITDGAVSPMGPIALFDKSFLQMLNVDEAALFDALFNSNICPIYYVEVLADLALEVSGDRTCEKVVADIARKTPVLRSAPNVLHASLCLQELGGRKIDLGHHVPAIAGGKPTRHQGGVALVYEESPEAAAFSRWQDGRFHEVERDFASGWREQLRQTDHAAGAELVKRVLCIRESPKTLEDAVNLARVVVDGAGQRLRTLRAAFALLGLPDQVWPTICKRWKSHGGPPLPVYAPYTAHCLTTDVFFHLAIDKKLISPDRVSNRTDIAYLYYLPFAMIFVSNDKLHRRTVPLFLDKTQLFVGGEELKQDLRDLDAHYSGLPESEQQQGLFNLASRPPDDERFLTTRIWRHFGFDTRPAKPYRHDDNKEANDRLLALFEEMIASAKRPSGPQRFTQAELDDPPQLAIERKVPVRRGKWRMFPPDIKGEPM